MRRTIVIYVVSLLVFGSGIALTLRQGSRLTPAGPAAVVRASEPAPVIRPPTSGLRERLSEPLPLLLLQLLVIVCAARLCGMAIRRLGQPAVIGEIIAGIALGPSLLGALWPNVQAFLFPPSSVGVLKLLAEIGVLLFLFVVGLELDVAAVRGSAQAAFLVSHASIIVPYFLGVALALPLFPTLAPAGTRFVPFALFLGIAMSITAFPVLARILEEKGLTRTPLGGMAIACAAVDDATAWSLLAVVVATAQAAALMGALGTILWTAAFVLAMLGAVGPALRRALARFAGEEEPAKSAVAAALLVLFASALATELIGIHALFGAFLAGVVMPRDARFRRYLAERLERFSSVFLLPLFFAFTGLRTRIGLLSDAEGWLTCALVILVATAGKLGGGMVAARLTRMSWPDAFALGALLNTRGLMELIALNLGYELGILSPRIFAMMVLMALATTLATGPLLSLADAWRRSAEATSGSPRAAATRTEAR
jgi:Kef-type K+ transport system membrane component KefB